MSYSHFIGPGSHEQSSNGQGSHEQGSHEQRSHLLPCYGVIVIKKFSENYKVLMVCSDRGVWGFPKGGRENGETGMICAIRELEEETGLKKEDIILLSEDITGHGDYFEYSRNGKPTVGLYRAICEGEPTLCPQEGDEITQCRWISSEEINFLDLGHKKLMRTDILNKAIESLQEKYL